jgi:hypothetical protein
MRFILDAGGRPIAGFLMARVVWHAYRPSATGCPLRRACAMRVPVPVGLSYAADFFQAAASTPAQMSSVPPLRFTTRCTELLRIARRALEASSA